MTKSKKPLIACIGLLVAVCAALALYCILRPDAPAAGKKTVGVSVVLADGTVQTDASFETEAEFLRGAIEADCPEIVLDGTEGNYGLYVTAVNGTAADEAAQEWWCFTKNGEPLETGVDSTPVEDGAHYEITLTIGW